jgi:hypothetical protein
LPSAWFGYALAVIQSLRGVLFFLVMIGAVRVFMLIALTVAKS